MISNRFGVVLAGVAFSMLLTLPANAQQPRQNAPAARAADRTVFISRDEDGRARTRIIVQRRSFLDAGTNVLVGDRKYTDYVIPPNYVVTEPIKNTAFDRDLQTMPGPFDLPSPRNPRQW